MSRREPTKLTPELREHWQKKLEKSGFHDIEDAKGRFTDHPKDLFRARGFQSMDCMVAMRDYYYWASSRLIHGTFPSARDKKIWTLHSEGYTSREIEAHVDIGQGMICRIIKRLRLSLRLQEELTLDDPGNPRIVTEPISDSKSAPHPPRRQRVGEKDFE